ncbi:MAG: 2-hydroxyacid dehydrogenase [Chitinophagaceae bacterium]
MKTLYYSTKDFERKYMADVSDDLLQVSMTTKALGPDTVPDATGFEAISIFTGDDASAPVLEKLKIAGVKYIAIRAAGYDNVDLDKAAELGIRVANVPKYSPYAIAEHALTLILALNRKIVTADKQVHKGDFRVDNLIGFDIHNKTVGVIGTGKTGSILIKILSGFGCRILAYDIHENKQLAKDYKVEYVSPAILCRESDIISIHTSLNPHTKYMINKNMMELMKPGVMLINTSRGACVNTEDVLHYLENGHIGYFGADVYEHEKGLFFYDWSGKEIKDDLLKRLIAMSNVLITPHQAFATNEAIGNIFQTTFQTLHCWSNDRTAEHELVAGYEITAQAGQKNECIQQTHYYDRQTF